IETASPVGFVVAVTERGEPVYVWFRLLSVTVAATVPAVPVPVSGIACTALVTFRLVSVCVTAPLIAPVTVGRKATEYRQDAPLANVDEWVVLGHVVAAVKEKFAEMLALVVPAAGTA